MLGPKKQDFWARINILKGLSKNVLLNWYSSMKKKIEKDFDDF